MYEFKLPDIGEGLSEAELLEWTVKIGDRVKEGDEVAMISTDKVNVDLTAPATGVVTELIGEPGDVIDVGTLIMRIDDGGEAETESETAEVREKPTVAIPAARRETASAEGPVKAAPIVRRYAADQGVDLSRISGTGPGGQVLRRDVDDFLAAGDASAGETFEVRKIKLSGPRLAAAQRLQQGYRTQVTTTITFEARADALLQELQRLSGDAGENSARPTPTALVANCLVTALGKHPHFNATISEDDKELLIHDHVNLGLAVDTGEGLVVPVIRGVEKMSVIEIAEEVVKKAELARSGGLGLEDVRDSTFTLSSTGSLEQATITATAPIINYPNVATLWFSRISERPRVTDGNLEAGPMMYCSLSFDHRYLHGADGMAFINDLVKTLEKPA